MNWWQISLLCAGSFYLGIMLMAMLSISRENE